MTLLCAVCLERAHNASIRHPDWGDDDLPRVNVALTVAYGGDALCPDCLREMREFVEDRSAENARFLGRPPIAFDIIDQPRTEETPTP